MSGSTSVAGAAHDPLDDLEPCARRSRSPARPDRTRARPASPRHRRCRESAADGPATPTAASSAATEARLMIETTFAATSEKLWPSALQHLRRAAQLRRHEAAEEGLDREPAFLGVRGRRAPARGPRRGWSGVRSRRRSGCQASASRSLQHQHQEPGLREIAGRGRVEAARGRSRSRRCGRPGSVRPGSSRPRQLLGAQALHRIAIDRLRISLAIGHRLRHC